jgi:diaminopimelate epimerase
MMASSLGIINGIAKFNAYDGVHEAQLLANGNVRLRMNDVGEIKTLGDGVFLNTGSPHFIKWIKEINGYPVFEEGKRIRYSDAFKPAGTNVNFVESIGENSIFVRTYEKGVENETLSCGTGVTAAALASTSNHFVSPIAVKTLGGELSVEFKVSHDGSFTDIFLIGPAKMVFQGILEL